MSLTWNDWVRRLRHDLVKRLLWPARDRRDMGGPVWPGELVVALIDDEGNPATAEAIWARLRDDAPTPGHAAVATFESALLQAVTAAKVNNLATVLALEAAFDRLTMDLAKEKN